MDDPVNNGWAHVNTKSLEDRNKDLMWTGGEYNKGVCKGIRVKYECGGSAAGFLYPICITVSRLSKDELQKDEVVVFPIEWQYINGHIDPRNRDTGYMC